jgi:hypothetical protein
MRMWCRNLLKHALQAITCIQEDPGYGKYHGLEDSDDHPSLAIFLIRSHSQSSIVTSSDDELYLAGLYSDPSTTKNFMPSKVNDCPDLFSHHEEADT